MNKSTKGALAAAAAALLLVGGVGSFAFWDASQDVDGLETITAGELGLSALTCADWVFDDGEDVPGAVYSGQPIVPGDVLSTTCNGVITAVGEHLRAEFAVTGGGVGGDLAPWIDADVVATVGGTEVPAITEAHHNAPVVLSVSLAFDPAADNDTQELTASLDTITVTLQQVHG